MRGWVVVVARVVVGRGEERAARGEGVSRESAERGVREAGEGVELSRPAQYWRSSNECGSVVVSSVRTARAAAVRAAAVEVNGLCTFLCTAL